MQIKPYSLCICTLLQREHRFSHSLILTSGFMWVQLGNMINLINNFKVPKLLKTVKRQSIISIMSLSETRKAIWIYGFAFFTKAGCWTFSSVWSADRYLFWPDFWFQIPNALKVSNICWRDQICFTQKCCCSIMASAAGIPVPQSHPCLLLMFPLKIWSPSLNTETSGAMKS